MGHLRNDQRGIKLQIKVDDVGVTEKEQEYPEEKEKKILGGGQTPSR